MEPNQAVPPGPSQVDTANTPRGQTRREDALTLATFGLDHLAAAADAIVFGPGHLEARVGRPLLVRGPTHPGHDEPRGTPPAAPVGGSQPALPGRAWRGVAHVADKTRNVAHRGFFMPMSGTVDVD